MDSAVVENDNVILLYSNGSHPIRRADLVVDFREEYCRKRLPCDLESLIDVTWNKRLNKNPTLWNGSKFRLNSVTQNVWRVGMTCYRDMIGTNYSPRCDDIVRHGLQLGDEGIYLANPLGVGAIVICADDSTFLLRRSMNVGESPGQLDIPGGHPEPQAVFKTESTNFADLPKLGSHEEYCSAVRNQIFDSIIDEIIAEVNIPNQELSEPLLMGVALHKKSALRPAAEFVIQTHLTVKEVESLYNKGTQTEADETVEFISISQSSLLNLRSNKELWDQLAPSAQGCLLLYYDYLCCRNENAA